jgi:hypothetical protein
MQTSNRDNPIENNLSDILHTLDKLSVRLPSLLSKEDITLTTEQAAVLQNNAALFAATANNIKQSIL